MPDPVKADPRDVSETNIALHAVMAKLAERLNFESKTLIHGQEDVLKLCEYQALFEMDMAICEDALDLLIALATQQKEYLKALVCAKKLERSLPSNITQALTSAETEASKANDLRKRVKKGDFSFLPSNDIRCNQSSSLKSSEIKSSSIADLTTTAYVANSTDDPNFEQTRTAKISQPTVCSTNMAVGFRIRERPQFSSDAARRVLGEINHLEEMHKSIRKPSSKRTQISLEKSTKLHSHGFSAERHDAEERPNAKHISASGGCSLDGSIMDFGENSGQNGLRAYSPVQNIPPQPNFDETDFDYICEPGVALPHNRAVKKEAGDTKSSESERLIIRSKENASSQSREECSKATVDSGLTEHASWSSSSYVPRARPKFTSSVGKRFNQE
ncbi:hypothetical protein RB195_010802 [Necator americanus]